MTKTPQTISSTLRGLLRTIESGFTGEGYLIWGVWAKAVGPKIAARAQPVNFVKGRLTVAVDGASWMQQLTLMAPQLIEALNGEIGHALVREIRLRAATVERPPPEPPPAPDYAAQPLDPEEEADIAALVRELPDPELAEAVGRARTMALKRAKHRRRQEG